MDERAKFSAVERRVDPTCRERDDERIKCVKRGNEMMEPAVRKSGAETDGRKLLP